MEAKSPVNRNQSGNALKHEAEEVSRVKRTDDGNEACYFGARRRLQHLDVVSAKTSKARALLLFVHDKFCPPQSMYKFPIYLSGSL